jgi:hypothetical protein
LGAEDVSREEKKGGSEEPSVTFKVHEQCPYDAVQVDVFNISEGGQTINKSQFFSVAEDIQAPDTTSYRPVK